MPCGHFAHKKVLPHGEIGKDLPSLWNVADARPRSLIGARGGQVPPAKVDRSGAGAQQAGERAHQRGFAHTIPPDHRDYLAGVYLHRYALKDPLCPVSALKI